MKKLVLTLELYLIKQIQMRFKFKPEYYYIPSLESHSVGHLYYQTIHGCVAFKQKLFFKANVMYICIL